MKESLSLIRAQKAVAIINELKEQKSAFTGISLSHALKMSGCPYSQFVFSILKKTGMIVKFKKREYVFAYDAPVYYKTIQKGLDECATNQLDYTKKYKGKPELVQNSFGDIVSNSEIIDFIDPIEEAIALLKANGYKLQRPVIKYENC